MWKSWSKVVTARFRTGSELTSRRSWPLEKYDQRMIRVDVEVSKEANPRLADQQVRVEITIRSKGPVIRAEAAAEDKMSALDKAVDRLSAQARKASDRRRIHHGSRTPTSLAQAMAARGPADPDVTDARPTRATASSGRPARSRCSATGLSSSGRSHTRRPR